jgi:hypothetical protein
VEKFYFTNNGLECDKIGVRYEAFQMQPDFCHSPLGELLAQSALVLYGGIIM